MGEAGASHDRGPVGGGQAGQHEAQHRPGVVRRGESRRGIQLVEIERVELGMRYQRGSHASS
ncbi:hypothetical protein [Nocardia tengchongensis]|uniref:hypothetical protein n=1 Tax=Nocardia tengchongensis TaxID=2055889 RepID=UPI00368D9C08